MAMDIKAKDDKGNDVAVAVKMTGSTKVLFEAKKAVSTPRPEGGGGGHPWPSVLKTPTSKPEALDANGYFDRGLAFGQEGDNDRPSPISQSHRTESAVCPRLLQPGRQSTNASGHTTGPSPISNKANRTRPEVRPSLQWPGHHLYKKGENDKAISDYNKAIELAPRDAEVYCKSGYRL